MGAIWGFGCPCLCAFIAAHGWEKRSWESWKMSSSQHCLKESTWCNGTSLMEVYTALTVAKGISLTSVGGLCSFLKWNTKAQQRVRWKGKPVSNLRRMTSECGVGLRKRSMWFEEFIRTLYKQYFLSFLPSKAIIILGEKKEKQVKPGNEWHEMVLMFTILFDFLPLGMGSDLI